MVEPLKKETFVLMIMFFISWIGLMIMGYILNEIMIVVFSTIFASGAGAFAITYKMG